jgi:T5SS/PEP-CTERM-associated repeat protein
MTVAVNSELLIGSAASAGGVLTIGAGGQLFGSPVLRIGNAGNGTMTVNAGGRATSGGVQTPIAFAAGSSGTVNVDGANSVWADASSQLNIGDTGAGAMNVTAGGRPWELLELDYLLRGYEQIGYHAVNVGAREAGLPEQELASIIQKFPFIVSANVVDANGSLIAPAYRLVTLPSGYQAGVLGIVDDTLLPDEIGAGLTITSPEEAIAKVLPKVAAETDFIVLLAFADESAMKALARATVAAVIALVIAFFAASSSRAR